MGNKKIWIIFLGLLLLMPSGLAFAEEPSVWAEDSINELKEIHYFSDEAFQNYQKEITRGEFIYFAVGMYEIMSGREIVLDEDIFFTDTTDIYALKGASVGITAGIGNNQFGYDQPLTRAQLATFMVKVLSILEVPMTPGSDDLFLDDGQIPSWAKESVYMAKSNNIISGVGNNAMNPEGSATVEATMTVVNKILKEKNGLPALDQFGNRVIIDIYKSVNKSASIDTRTNDQGSSNFTILETTYEDEMISVGKDIEIKLPAFFDGQGKSLVVEEVKQANEVENALTIYDITLEDVHELDTYIEIIIPYDNKVSEESLYAAYFNEENEIWTPLPYSLDNGQATVYTNHLSWFGLFESEDNDNTAKKDVSEMDYDKAMQIYNDVSSSGTVNVPSAIEEGWKGVTSGLSQIGPSTTFLEEAIQMEAFKNINNQLGNVGLATTGLQFVIDFSKGDDKSMAINATKFYMDQTISKYFSTSALKIASLGTFAIDYSLNAFATEAIEGRYALHEKAFYEFYRSDSSVKDLYVNSGRGSHVMWYKKIKPLFDKATSAESAKIEIENMLEEYSNKYWENDENVYEYMSYVSEGGWTADAGLNEDMKKSLSANLYAMTAKSLEPVFTQIAKNIRIEQEMDLYRKEEEVRKLFKHRTSLRVQILGDEGQTSGINVNVLNENEAVYSAVTDSSGQVTFEFTNAEYVNNKRPSVVKIEVDDKTYNQDFTVDGIEDDVLVQIQVDKKEEVVEEKADEAPEEDVLEADEKTVQESGEVTELDETVDENSDQSIVEDTDDPYRKFMSDHYTFNFSEMEYKEGQKRVDYVFKEIPDMSKRYAPIFIVFYDAERTQPKIVHYTLINDHYTEHSKVRRDMDLRVNDNQYGGFEKYSENGILIQEYYESYDGDDWIIENTYYDENGNWFSTTKIVNDEIVSQDIRE
ncbi:S-layer homology domain-containing protein [Fusibacter sp. JL216-2]|uniref:S-layer homology domain-containing protein n=1 Tax=Fusibacter sp. JL216-2 TaxID=3071453 RepID=UPI003D3436CF